MIGWNWQEKAACRGVDPMLFDRPDGYGRTVPKSAQYAASYCLECPVRRECRAVADENRDEGVRDGTWRVKTSKGYQALEITPLTSRSIRVTHHSTVRAFQHATITDPERAAS